jgi:hypothetical protein
MIPSSKIQEIMSKFRNKPPMYGEKKNTRTNNPPKLKIAKMSPIGNHPAFMSIV